MGIWGGAGSPYPPTGTAFSDFLYELNDCTSSDGTAATTAGLAGHCDWRLPAIQELKTIIDLDACGGGNPCIDPIFGPSAANIYGSATTVASDPAYAWFVHFFDGSVSFGGKVGSVRVRAVRTGS